MGLQQKFRDDLKVAMKAKDSERTGAIRVVMGEFARETTKELNDEQVVAILKKLVKSEKELLQAKKEQESPFLHILEEYLPQQASPDEIRAWIESNIDFSSLANKMQAMRPIMQHFGNSADGNVVKKVLQEMD